jgi:hypothetical protein
MNERPDEPESKQKAFKPQFGATGQAMHYHSEPGELHWDECSPCLFVGAWGALSPCSPRSSV